MRPVEQTTFGVPTGNCFGACVASLLELDEIPCPVDPAHPDEDFWYEEWRKWFAAQGLEWT